MAFTEHQNTERFSLLLLEPGEIYFQDYGVYLYPDDVPEAEALKRRQKGRLKICSKSLLFVPEEINRPILKFPLNKHSIAENWTGPLLSKLHSKENIFRLQNDHVVEMLEGNFIKPYVFIRKKVSYRFSLTYGSVEKCLTHILQLMRASTLPAAEHDCMIATMVLSWQSRISFDRSCLGNLYEQIVLETRANKITPLVINPGLVLLTSQRLYFQPFNNVEPWPCLKVNLSDVKRVIQRRFLLRQIGLELYCSDNSLVRHLFLAFKSKHERDALYLHLMDQSALQLEDSGQENMTLRWQNGVISNYDYLLYLNSLADRSFNDLTQYLVFPWVISDYRSTTLDLEDISIYRDLSRPVGALNKERLQKLKGRYEEMGDPKFLYGSHYSTPGFVLFYLVRKMPQYMLCLQNGRFDHPDRMFNSISDTWRNVTTDLSDFKELIPEFYDTSTKGDFLTNTKSLDFGIKHDGKVVGDVELPPWAKGPEDLIYTFRQALESSYVSENLHNWIDLIFGYKQTGEEAVKANNLFYYLTYEGNIDLDNIKEMHERHSLEVQIMEFGQTPKQIFTQPHPQRLPTSPIERKLTFSEVSTISEPNTVGAETTTSTQDEMGSHGRRSSSLVFHWKRNMANLTKIVQHELHKERITDVCFSHNAEGVFSVSQDSLLKLFSLREKQQIRSVCISNMALSSCLLLSDKTVVVGSWDSYIYIYDIEFGKVDNCKVAHDDAVCDISWKNGVLATASWDSTAKIWSFRPQENCRGSTTARLQAELEHESGVSCVDLKEDDPCQLTSGTVDGCVTLWDLKSSSCMGRFEIHSSTVTSVAFNPDGSKIVSCSDDQTLKVLDVQTGTILFSKDAGSELRCLCWDGATVLTGCESGAILTWDLLNAELLKETPAHNGAVTCITVSHDGSFVASGGEDRKVIVWQSSEV